MVLQRAVLVVDRRGERYRVLEDGQWGEATGRTKRGKRTKGQYGDIVATDPIGAPLLELVVFELKRGYNQATIADLLDKPPKAAKQAYEKWIAKAREDANAAGVPYWLLIHKRDKREPVIFLPIDLMRVPAFNSGDISSRATINVQAEGLYIYAAYLKDFFKEVQPPLLSIHDLCPTPKKKSG